MLPHPGLIVCSLRIAFAKGAAVDGVAGVDDDDDEVDRRASGNGHARLSEPSRVSVQEAGRGVDNIKN
jgi:hypothetical protein